MLRYVPLLVLPYIVNVWPLIAIFGMICVFLFIVGLFMFSRPRNMIKPKRILLNPKKTMLKNTTGQETLLNKSIKSILLSLVRTSLLEHGTDLPDIMLKFRGPGGLEDHEIQNLMVRKLSVLANDIVGFLGFGKSFQLPELVLITLAKKLKDHIQLYKKYRKELEGDGTLKTLALHKKFRHLDDFNDYHVESTDESSHWSAAVDKVNQQILNRLKAQGGLHPALGEHEQVYLQAMCSKLIDLLNSPSFVQRPPLVGIVKVLLREYILSQVLVPIVQRLTRPELINRDILYIANRRIITQKSCKAFRGALDNAFMHFPPYFLLRDKQEPFLEMNHAKKMKYLENTMRYHKKISSVIDLNALLYDVITESRRIQEKMVALKQETKDDKRLLDLQKYFRAFEILKVKLKKRIDAVIAEDQHTLSHPSRHFRGATTETTEDVVDLSLPSVLEGYYKFFIENSSSKSSSIFYFLEFVEECPDASLVMHLLRYWSHAQKYRSLILI